MSKKNPHYKYLPTLLEKYGDERGMDYHRYSDYHMRLMDGGFCVLDVWTTGKYYALATNYNEMNPDERIRERGGEKGWIPTQEQPLYKWLDSFFFPTKH